MGEGKRRGRRETNGGNDNWEKLKCEEGKKDFGFGPLKLGNLKLRNLRQLVKKGANRTWRYETFISRRKGRMRNGRRWRTGRRRNSHQRKACEWEASGKTFRHKDLSHPLSLCGPACPSPQPVLSWWKFKVMPSCKIQGQSGIGQSWWTGLAEASERGYISAYHQEQEGESRERRRGRGEGWEREREGGCCWWFSGLHAKT